MRSTKLTSVLVQSILTGVFVSAPVLATGANVRVAPLRPDSRIPVTITVAGTLPSACYEATLSTIALEGNQFTLGLVVEYRDEEICTQAVTHFSLAHAAGRLAAGTYSVSVDQLAGPHLWEPLASIDFTVTEPLESPRPGLQLSRYTNGARVPFDAEPVAAALLSEASAVAHNPDTDTLFVLGDEGWGIVELRKTGEAIGYMTLQGFEDTEGLAYVGNGELLIAEERHQDVFQVQFVAGGNRDRSSLEFWDLGPYAGNSGLEGVSFDPLSRTLVTVKEKAPQEINEIELFEGSGVEVTPLFDPDCALEQPGCLDVDDLADVQALSTVSAFARTAANANLLVVSQASSRLIEVDRAGNIVSELDLQPYGFSSQIEGVTVDSAGNIYLVAESYFHDVTGAVVNESALFVLRPAALTIAADKRTVEWSPAIGATSYNTYRGMLRDLVTDGPYGDCVRTQDPDSTDTRFVDGDVPVPGEGYFYLVAGNSAAGERNIGFDSAGRARIAEPCPLP